MSIATLGIDISKDKLDVALYEILSNVVDRRRIGGVFLNL